VIHLDIHRCDNRAASSSIFTHHRRSSRIGDPDEQTISERFTPPP
jgi:hypothetical protein